MRDIECVPLSSPLSLGSQLFHKDLAADLTKTYKIDDKNMNQAMELKIGRSVRVMTMEKVSNGAFTEVGRSQEHGTNNVLTFVDRKSFTGLRAHWQPRRLICLRRSSWRRKQNK